MTLEISEKTMYREYWGWYDLLLRFDVIFRGIFTRHLNLIEHFGSRGYRAIRFETSLAS